MDASPSPALPTWVRKRDGSRVPFDADKINRALFAATESLGEPDAFVARELTDGVLHFLAAESDGNLISSAQIEETLVKVVRELGHAKLARAFAEFSRRRDRTAAGVRSQESGVRGQESGVSKLGPTGRQIRGWIEAGQGLLALAEKSGEAALEEFSLEEVFSKNLAAAHREGLLALGNLATPLHLAAAVVRPAVTTPAHAGGAWRPPGIFEVIEQAGRYAGETLALDAPERELAQRGARIGEVAAFLRELALAARSTGLQVVLNLNSETAPSWAETWTEAPLFAEQRQPEGSERVFGHLDALVEQALMQGPAAHLRVDWHLAARDFADEACRRRLLRIASAALNGAPVTFVCDRPRRPVTLAAGLDRQHQAVLLWVGLHLPNLLHRLGSQGDPDTFLNKLMSLARLAASAGIQKRDFLRRCSVPDRPPFLIERAHLGIHLIGWLELLHSLFGASPWDSEPASAFVQQMLRRLQEVLDQEVHIKSLIDEPGGEWEVTSGPCMDWKNRLRVQGRWHGIAGRGTITFPLADNNVPGPAELVELLQFAWKQTPAARIRLARAAEKQKQLTVTWE